MRAVRGGDDVAFLERPTDADGDRLLPDRDVQEARQLTRAETLLDLLLEPPDQQHFTEEFAEVRLRERPFLLYLRHEPESMLRLLNLVDQFNAIVRGVDDDWAELRFDFIVTDASRRERAAALLGPANPGMSRDTIRFTVAQRGGGIGPEAARRLLRRLVRQGVDGRLELRATESTAASTFRQRPSLREQWERALADLPADWSDVYAEVRFDSTDYVEPGALMLAPANPAAYGGPGALRFRCAHRFGYGVSPGMAGRCLERCDERGITGEVQILRALSDTYPVGTQGPVWLVGGRAV